MLGRRYSDFDVLMQWIHVLREHHWPGPTFTARDLYPAEGRNVITAGALLRDDWDDFLSIDSDQLPAPTFIERIAEYPLEVELVIGTYFAREYPFDLQAWTSTPDLEGLQAIHPARVDEMLQKPGLYRVGGGGTGFMLIRRRVLERLQEIKGAGHVWEIRGLSPELEEKLGTGLVLGEDVTFCMDVQRLLGVQAWLDTDPRIESQHMQSSRVDRRNWYAAHMAPVVMDRDAVQAALVRSGHSLEIDRVRDAELETVARAQGRREARAARRLGIVDRIRGR